MEDTTIDTRPGMGMVVIATRSFDVFGTKLRNRLWPGPQMIGPNSCRKFKTIHVLVVIMPPISSEVMMPLRAQATADPRVAREYTHKWPSLLR
jgi:hypothetical protein